MRRSPAAARSRCQPARVRGVRHHPGAVGRPQRRRRATPRGRSTRNATASSWARARRCSCSRRPRSPSARGATPVRRAARLRRDLRCPSHGPAAGRRTRGGPGGDDRPRRRRRRPGEIDYVNAHASSTPIGDVAEARAIALALGERAATVAGQRHQGAVRPSARRVGRDRGGDLRAGDPRRLGAGVGQPRRAGSGARRRCCPACCGRAATATTGGCCRPRSGSAG